MRVVLTGGPMAGKSAVLEELGLRGFATLPETARRLLMEIHGAGENADVTVRSLQFNDRVLSEQLAAERALSENQITVLDRSLLDNVAYRRLLGLPTPMIAVPQYDAVFLLDLLPAHMWPSQARATATERLNYAQAIQDMLQGVYREMGYAPIRVPVLSIVERATNIVESMRRLGLCV